MSVLTAHDPEYALLTVAEAADELRCSEPTIRRRIRDGHLSAVRVGPNGPLRIPRKSLQRQLCGMTTASTKGES